MTGALMLLAPLLALGVVVVLARGIWGFSQSERGESAARFSNRMMRWRVGLQFLALMAFMLLYAMMKKGG